MELATEIWKERSDEIAIVRLGAIASRYFDDTVSSQNKTEHRVGVPFIMELLTGFEPVTSSLPRTCSTC